MDIKNLRVGNWVEIIQPNKEVYTTIQPSCFSVEIKKFYNPIPLTEEWLLKFGFKNIKFKYEINNFIIWLDPRSTYYYLNYEGGNIEIKYVHELQNLYFALTGKELAKV